MYVYLTVDCLLAGEMTIRCVCICRNAKGVASQEAYTHVHACLCRCIQLFRHCVY